MDLNNMLEVRDVCPSQSDTELKTEDHLIPPTNFYFNPVIYFPCKLCRQAFSTVDRLLQHKRRKHTWSELKEIKFILFEERFVHDEFSFHNLLLPQENFIEEIKTEKHETTVLNSFLVSSETNDEQTKVQVKTSHVVITVANPEETLSMNSEEETNINGKVDRDEMPLTSCLNRNVESNSSNSKKNPYVRLVRMTETEIHDVRNNSSKDNLSIRTSEKTQQEQEKAKRNFQDYSLNTKNSNNEFIILDVIPQPDGQREITFTTSTRVNADQSLLLAEQEGAPESEATKEKELKPEPKYLVQDEPAEQVDDEDGVSIPNVGNLEESEFNSEPESELEPAPAPEPTPKPNTESTDSSATILNVEAKAPSKRYNKRRCTEVTKNYIDAEEFQCAKCSFLSFSQSELDEHTKFYCKKMLSNKESENKTIICLDSESDHEWAENSGEDSDSEAEEQNHENERTTHNFTCHPELSENDIDLRRKVKYPTGSQERFANKADPMLHMTAEFVSTSSLKQWLKIYKKHHPNKCLYFDPDPLQEPDQCQNRDSSCVETGTKTVLFPLRCKLCNIKLDTEARAKEHAITCWYFNKAIPRYCFICDKFFSTKNGLKIHNFSKHPELGEKDIRHKVKCPTCNKELIGTKNILEKHMAIHENNPEKKFKCEICDYCSRSKCHLKRHTERHSEDRPYKCPHCSMGFKTRDGLRSHKRKHSTVSYTCTQCPKTFRDLQYFRDHIRARHTQEKPFSCPHAFGSEKCFLKFSTRNQLVLHCRKEHPETVKKYPCTLCSKTFWNNANLKIHMITHTGVKPFKCTHEGCSRTFSMNFDLKEHMRTHTGENPFQCDACGKTFWKHFSWVTHCRVWCPNKSSAEDRNILLCHLCPRKFPIMWELKRHLKLHEKGKVSADGSVRGGAKGKVKGQEKEKGKELECEVCDFKCGTKKALKEHEKIHDESEDDEEDETTEEEESGDEAEETESSSDSSDLETEEYVALSVEATETDSCEKECGT